MPGAPPSSNIRAFVQWREPSVYAGEDIECIITFKNIAISSREEEESEELRQVKHAGVTKETLLGSRAPSAAEPHSRRTSVAQGKRTHSRAPSVASTKGPPLARAHRPTLSLNVVSNSAGNGPHTAPVSIQTPNSAVKASHGRSLSIVSLSSDKTSETRAASMGTMAKRPVRGHTRSASLQSMPIRRPQASPYIGALPSRQPSPLYESVTPPAAAEGQTEVPQIRPPRRRPGVRSTSNTPHIAQHHGSPKSSAANDFNNGFNFPVAKPTVKHAPSPVEEQKPTRSLSNLRSAQQRANSPRPPDGWSGALSSLNPISRVLSETSTATPRSSSEFYSISNRSDETLTSELPYQNQQSKGRLLPETSHSRQVSDAKSNKHPAEPETLMMGYVQTTGSFVVDGSLVNAAPFEEVKRKGVQSVGGVVGVERAKRSSGMFGAFGWGNFGESLGGLLGSDDRSSIAQMKAIANAKSVPLLQTSQNLLFVDLRLAPGESASYNYRFTLPRGLPPTHKGRAIKVSYHLSLGIQRIGAQAVKHISIPFRVLGSYNERGETLGHDLICPYILLQDIAHSDSVTSDQHDQSGLPKFAPKEAAQQAKTPQQGLEDFLRYTERLLEQAEDTKDALLSPTSPSPPTRSRNQSLADPLPASVKEAIDLAILRANYGQSSSSQPASESQSTNRFKIARGGQPVALLTLSRPAFRLGEALTGIIDFTSPSPAPETRTPSATFSVLIELESAERVDSTLALRSTNSIHRVTRKVHSSARENTVFARQISFNLPIPFAATPMFETTGVSLVWRLRVEFTTQRQVHGLGLNTANDAGELLEEVGSDERGVTSLAREVLVADTFEISVPLRVYGAPGTEGMSGVIEPLQV